MRYLELTSGIRLPLSSEELEIIALIKKSDKSFILNSSLDERQQEVARLMVSRGAIKQKDIENDYKLSLYLNELTRFKD